VEPSFEVGIGVFHRSSTEESLSVELEESVAHRTDSRSVRRPENHPI